MSKTKPQDQVVVTSIPAASQALFPVPIQPVCFSLLPSLLLGAPAKNLPPNLPSLKINQPRGRAAGSHGCSVFRFSECFPKQPHTFAFTPMACKSSDFSTPLLAPAFLFFEHSHPDVCQGTSHGACIQKNWNQDLKELFTFPS